VSPGEKINQDIYDDPYDFNDWDQGLSSRCFVHLANSLVWRSITGKEPPAYSAESGQSVETGH
jgi:hypothetical protein